MSGDEWLVSASEKFNWRRVSSFSFYGYLNYFIAELTPFSFYPVFPVTMKIRISEKIILNIDISILFL